MITYNPFWESLKKRGISTYSLEKDYGMNKNMIHNLKHDKSITIYSLNKLCDTFDLEILEVIEYHKKK